MTDVIVLGGGMVGITTALALQAKGRDVTIVDNGDPSRRSSAGNAGIIQVEAAEPYAMPQSLGELLAVAMRRSNAVSWHWNALPSHLVPLWKYFRNSRPSRHRQISRTYAQLTGRATRDHAPLISASGADMLICRKGFRHAYRDKQELTGAIARAERMAREYGVAFEPLDGRALQRAEPNLLIPLAGAIQWLDPWTCRDPEALVAAYTKLFKAAGGTVVSGDAMTLHARQGKWAVDIPGATGPMVARDAVICLGSQSAQLTTRFGLRVPLFCKRGYHLQLKSSRGPNLLLVDAKNSTVLAPMVSGLRILTGAELSRPSSAGTTSQLNHAIVSARELFEIEAPRDADPWMGNRPCMPDMLPVVGAVPGQSGLWANFGHGHQGFTLGPTTASLLAHEMAGNSATFPELSPCYRF